MPLFTRVSPSIIAVDYKNPDILNKALEDIEEGGANFVHLDVMDGKFVKNKTFDHEFVDYVKNHTTLLLDVHLMVENPEKVVDDYIEAGADVLHFHYEATKNPEALLKHIKSKNVLAGLAISPSTPAFKIKDLLNRNLVDVVLVMGVEPGASGQTFIPGSAEKVAEVRELDKSVYIEIDGGVNLKNSKVLRKLGANILVSGSCVFESRNVSKTIRALKGRDWRIHMHSL
ncbi:MAG: ribulose-phosphate 3-epimerase [Clostridia bacterium]|nr:ribulose-phosphate 3-epimerase [Clostridia bacterium]